MKRGIIILLKENEGIEDLEYKGLKIIQNKKGFRFGIDSVLLSDFAKEIKKDSKVIDLGTGTGIISILLCGKTKLKEIIGVEIQKDVYDMAKRSSKINSLENKFKVINEDLNNIRKNFPANSIDAIVTNPPYKRINTGVTNENISKQISRHEVMCNIEGIANISNYLLKDKASIYLVHRPNRLVDIINALTKYKLEPKKMQFVYPTKESEPNLVLIKATKNGRPFLKIEKPLIVYSEDGKYTKEILKIYNKE